MKLRRPIYHQYRYVRTYNVYFCYNYDSFSIKPGIIHYSDDLIPMISNVKVLVGPESDDGKHRWYFSLNNRRLYVLKRCREEGLLKGTNNLILVRVREPKSQSEIERYTVSNCAVEAKIIPEKRAKEKRTHGNNAGSCHESNVNKIAGYMVKPDDDGDNHTNDDADDGDDDDDESDDSDSGCDSKKSKYSNRFNALI